MPVLPAILPVTPLEGDLPVRDGADVLDTFPDFAKGQDVAPVRDAIVEGLTALHLTYQEQAAYAAAQADPTRSTGIYLDAHAEDRGFHRVDPDDEVMRAAVFSVPSVVTPNAIVRVVNALLAPYTPVKCQLIDGILDRLFLSDDSGPWHSFLDDTDPDYPDRYYDERVQAHPGRNFPIDDSIGRLFILRVPILGDIESVGAFLFDAAPDGAFLSDYPASPLPNPVSAFLSGSAATALGVYQAIVATVEAKRGQGVRWILTVDPLLT